MRKTIAGLEARVEELAHALRQARAERDQAVQMAEYDHRLVERLLTIFERTAGEANLRLSAAGALTATDLELAKKLPAKKPW